VAAPSIGRGNRSLARVSFSRQLTERITPCLQIAVEWLVAFIVHHWLLIANLAFFLFVAPPFLAPLLEAAGLHLPARIIFLVYRPTCHQLPERSYFILGHQVAVCARCAALYVSFWGMGLVYALVSGVWRARVPVWRAPALRWVGVATIPLAVDGLTQLVGLRTSTNLLRTFTGVLTGGAAGAFIYPYMHLGFADARRVW
jgi:uncharacterized membrane protein